MSAPIRDDFDAIARATPERCRWNHNNHYHTRLLGLLPPDRRAALDLGCGTGDFAELLSEEFREVTAVDFSHEMILRARRRLSGKRNVRLLEVDIMEADFAAESFDFIASVATFHHLSLEAIFRKCRDWLAPGGTLVVLDLAKPEKIAEILTAGVSVPVNWAAEVIRNRGRPRSEEETAAWLRHGKHESYHSLGEIRAAASSDLPRARIRYLMYWRYMLTWRKKAT